MPCFLGSPELGWTDTLAFLSLPVLLFASQSFSSKVMAAPRDESKPMTEQELMSQSIVNNLPFITAFFSLNVPAGLAVYWIINNILTTGITLLVRNQFKDEVMPAEVDMMMAEVDAPVVVKKVKNAPGSSELRKMALIEDNKKESGFSSTLQAIEATMNSEGSGGSTASDDDDEDDDDDDEEDDEDTSEADDEKKRKRRAASRNKSSRKT
jgi:YidC/Oxa1 family membrane protein insertase